MTDREKEIYLKGYADGMSSVCRSLSDTFHREEKASLVKRNETENRFLREYYDGISFAFNECRRLAYAASDEIVKD